MAKRTNISKRTRFEVFKRDHFTCQYCGAQPPAVVLVIDHIHPIALGGTNDETNLTTACEPCNQGKSDKLLSKVPIRPDADLMYLEAQQEISELRRYQEVQQSLRAQRMESARWLCSTWCEISEETWHPTEEIVIKMLSMGSFESAHIAITTTAYKLKLGEIKERGWEKYLWGVFWRSEKESGGDPNG